MTTPTTMMLEPSAAAFLGVSRAWLKQMRMAGTGPDYTVIGTAIIYSKESLSNFAKVTVLPISDKGRHAVTLFSVTKDFFDSLTDAQLQQLNGMLATEQKAKLSLVDRFLDKMQTAKQKAKKMSKGQTTLADCGISP